MSEALTPFLAERQTGIGGSDIAALFNIGYGCQLRLWRQKRGEEPDFPVNESGPMKLGRILEAFFADEYTRVTGRHVRTIGVQRHPKHPELLVHVDRIINDPGAKGSDDGTLEVKAFGREMYFKVKREGMIEDYVLQLQHGMLVSGHEWGEFAAGARDSGDLLPPFRMERDRAITDEILSAGPSFWKQVQENVPPALLSPDDPRCERCEFRRSCQGNALMEVAKGDKGLIETDESMRPLREEFWERKEMLEEAEGLINETREEIRARMGDRTAVMVAGKPIYHRPQVAMRWQGGELAAELARMRSKVDYDGTIIAGDMVQIEREFKAETVSRPLRVY